MPTCCSVTFVVFVAMAMGASIGSMFLPLFVIVPQDDVTLAACNALSSGSGAEASDPPSLPFGLRHLGVSIPARRPEHEVPVTSARKDFKEQGLPGLPRCSLQCPFFDGKCQIDGYEVDATTDEVLAEFFLCGDKMGSWNDAQFPRLWSIIAAAVSFVVFVLGCLHMAKSQDLGMHGGFIKFGIAGIGAHHLAASGYSIYKQAMISQCIQDSVAFKSIPVVLGDCVMVMISMIVLAFAAFVMLWCSLGMMCSWCCSCCGAPAGNQYNNQSQTQINMQMINAYPPVAVNPGYDGGYAQAAGYPPAYAPPQQPQQQQAPYNPYGKQQY